MSTSLPIPSRYQSTLCPWVISRPWRLAYSLPLIPLTDKFTTDVIQAAFLCFWFVFSSLRGSCTFPDAFMISTKWRILFSISLLHLTVHHITLLKTFIAVYIMRFNIKVISNVVVQVPGLVFIVHHEEQSKFLFHVSPSSVGSLALQGARPANDQRPQETAIQVLEMWKMIVKYTNCAKLVIRIWIYEQNMYLDKINVGVVCVRGAVRIREPRTGAFWNIPRQLYY